MFPERSGRMIDGSENGNRWLRFEFQNSHVIENRNKVSSTQFTGKCSCYGSIYFPLFLVMIVYDSEFKTKENKIWTKDKIKPQHSQRWRRCCSITHEYWADTSFLLREILRFCTCRSGVPRVDISTVLPGVIVLWAIFQVLSKPNLKLLANRHWQRSLEAC